jgi:hypothetical protein
MSDEPYTNMDLETADQILISAGHGEIARALKYQTHGNRNLIQGEWGMKVVSAFEQILQVQVVKALASVQQTLDQQHDLVQQILVSQKNSEKTAKQALTVAKAGAARLGKLDKDVKQLKRAAVESKSEVAAVKAQMAALQARIDQQTEIERRLAALEARDGDGT